jgi:hypothetical protein
MGKFFPSPLASPWGIMVVYYKNIFDGDQIFFGGLGCSQSWSSNNTKKRNH